MKKTENQMTFCTKENMVRSCCQSSGAFWPRKCRNLKESKNIQAEKCQKHEFLDFSVNFWKRQQPNRPFFDAFEVLVYISLVDNLGWRSKGHDVSNIQWLAYKGMHKFAQSIHFCSSCIFCIWQLYMVSWGLLWLIQILLRIFESLQVALNPGFNLFQWIIKGLKLGKKHAFYSQENTQIRIIRMLQDVW